MQIKDLGDCCGWQALDRTDGQPLEDSCNYQGRVIRRDSTPHSTDNIENDPNKVHGAFPEQDSSRGCDHRAQA